jgi:hypothetical protein
MEPRRYAPLLPRKKFLHHVARSLRWAGLMVLGSLAIGVGGYHVFGRLSWLDALVNASMILTGMGPVDSIATTTGKLFESFYALFSGVAFLTIMAVILAPLVHRFLHRFHLDIMDDPSGKKP